MTEGERPDLPRPDDITTELAESATGLEVASQAAAKTLGLTPGSFDWFSGEISHAMFPQKVVPDHQLSDTYTDRVFFYGGGVKNEAGNFGFGYIQASIQEPIEGEHQAGGHQLPVPYITSFLTVKDSVITVDTPTTHASINEGPVVIESGNYNPRFRKTAVFYTRSSLLAIKSGQLITDGYGPIDDQTVEHDATELPQDIRLLRADTTLRTIKAASKIFDRIAWGDTDGIHVDIVRNSKK